MHRFGSPCDLKSNIAMPRVERHSESHMSTRKIVAGLILALVSEPSSAAIKQPHAVRRPVAAKAQSASSVLVDALFRNIAAPGESMANVCQRSDFAGLASALVDVKESLAAPKGEFESSEAYIQRTAKMEDVLGQPLFVCTALGRNALVPFQYDADNQAFSGSFYDKFTVWEKDRDLGSYRAKTVLGVPFTVYRSRDTRADLKLTAPVPSTCLDRPKYGAWKYTVPAPRETAPLLKAQGRLVMLVSLTSPFVSYERHTFDATLTEPDDRLVETATVMAKLIKMAVIDGKGAIVWSCDVGSAAEKPATP